MADLPRLHPSLLPQLSEAIRPGFDRSSLQTGILHLGVGNFHRAHQALYTQGALEQSGGHWGILGASLRTPTAAEQLNPQRPQRTSLRNR